MQFSTSDTEAHGEVTDYTRHRKAFCRPWELFKVLR